MAIVSPSPAATVCRRCYFLSPARSPLPLPGMITSLGLFGCILYRWWTHLIKNKRYKCEVQRSHSSKSRTALGVKQSPVTFSTKPTLLRLVLLGDSWHQCVCIFLKVLNLISVVYHSMLHNNPLAQNISRHLLIYTSMGLKI